MDPDRIQVIASKMAQSVAQQRKDGRGVASALIKELNYAKCKLASINVFLNALNASIVFSLSVASNVWACGMLRQQKLLTRISGDIRSVYNHDSSRFTKVESSVPIIE
jgi:hypothetical protein